MLQLLALLATLLAIVTGNQRLTSARSQVSDSERLKDIRQSTSQNPAQVYLGYGVYEGIANPTTGLTIWKGIRYAAPPVGALRWQRPQMPTIDRNGIIMADSYPPQCPQSPYSGAPTAHDTLADEDCLFLNIYAPSNASGLPVLVWIHGGGYGTGNASQYDLSTIVRANDNSFIAVAVQYRLGAFGFLSSDEVFRNGVPNAGLLDQHFALQWIQSYISLFGGDPAHVTISGESAGAGSVMLQSMAYGGTLGESLFTNVIAASPYLPKQYGYNDWSPSQTYYAFAQAAGCFPATHQSSAETLFNCLVAQNTTTLQEASFNVSTSGKYGTYGFLPVTDGSLVEQTLSQQLLKKRVNGRMLLIGNNANEGPLFTPQNITTESDLLAWLELTFPLMTNDDIAKILLYYPSSNDTAAALPKFATTGLSGPSALNESSVAAGQQQRANNIYAESTFVCPSYWMAEAFADKGRASYKYQYSVLPAVHGSDVTAYFGPALPYQGADLLRAFMTIWGNFITKDNPSISASIANGNVSDPDASSPLVKWPAFTIHEPFQINLNQSGGITYLLEAKQDILLPTVNTTVYTKPGLKNDFSLVNAYTWEAGRGYRCDFWRSVATIVPS